MTLDITFFVDALKSFNHGIIQKNYRKMTVKWSFTLNESLLLYAPVICNHGPPNPPEKAVQSYTKPRLLSF